MSARRWRRAALVSVSLAVLALTHGDRSIVAGQSSTPPAASSPLDRAMFASPPASVRPSIRWWWPGGDVDDQELARELTVMRDAGFGNAEIQSFAVGLPANASPVVNTYGTSTWFDHVSAALDRAATLGMTIDLTLGSAWPTAAVDTPYTLSLKQLTVTGRLVQGPATFDDLVPEPVEPLSYPIANSLLHFPNTYDRSKMGLVAVLAGRYAGDQSQDASASGAPALEDLPNLPPTVYLEAGSLTTLAPFLLPGNRLRWQVPAGTWMMFALYRGPTGSRPFYDANPAPALVIDHFSSTATINYLQGFGQNAANRFGSRLGSTLRSLFVDSLELRTELYWTDDVLDQFAARRGYRAEAFLPILFRPLADDAYLHKVYPTAPPTYDIRGVGRRVREDYQRTVGELMVERFFGPIRAWSDAHGVPARMQAHGAPVDLLNAYSKAAVPETEALYAGGRPAFLKYASSAAHTAGKPVVSSEILAFRNQAATPLRILQQANTQLVSGINQFVLHGFPYTYDAGFSFPGWMPFNSPYLPGQSLIGTYGSHLNDRNPIWPYMRSITDYLARAQLVMRTGSPVTDVAVFVEGLGYPDDATYNPAVPEALRSAGYDFDYVNSINLEQASVSANTLQIGANRYKALIVAGGPSMTTATAHLVSGFAASGLPLVIVGDVPHEGLGLQAMINGEDAAVQSQFEQLLNTTRDALPSSGILQAGSTLFVGGDGSSAPGALSSSLSVNPAVRIENGAAGVTYAHRHTDSGDYYLFASPADSAVDTHCTFANPDGRIPEIWNLRTGEVIAAPFYTNTGSETDVLLHFEPGTAVVVGFDRVGSVAHLEAGSTLPGVYRNANGDLVSLAPSPGSYMVSMNGGISQVLTIAGSTLAPIALPTWDIVVGTRDAAGQLGTQAFTRSSLTDLSPIEDYSGNARYTAYLDFANLGDYRKPEVRLLLDLGQLATAAQLRVNDKSATSVLTAPRFVDVTDDLVAGMNKFEVMVSTAPGDRPSGLLGPVTLVPRFRAVVPSFKPLQTSMVVTPPNFPNNSLDEFYSAIDRASTAVNHVNFQWFWKDPPSDAHPNGGTVVECPQVTAWVERARSRHLTVSLQFQAFYAQVQGSYVLALDGLLHRTNVPVVRVASPVAPFETASFADPAVANAYLDQVRCLADLKPDYLVLGPEVNFVRVFNPLEWAHYVPVYAKAYELAKLLSPTTQVGLSYQYDGLRHDRLENNDDWSVVKVAPKDFVAMTTYFGYSEDRNAEFPDPSLIPADYYGMIREVLGPTIPVIFSEVGWSSFFTNGLQTQAAFIRRMPELLGRANPDNVTWAMEHDVDYFAGAIGSLNASGLLMSNGTPKPSWNQVMTFKREGVLNGVTPHVFAPSPLPFTVSAGPALFPQQFTRDLALQGLDTASQLTGSVSLQFAWRDHVTRQIWNCEDVRPYVDEARRRGLRVTIQFNTFAALPAATPDGNPSVIVLNPIDPPKNDYDTGPSFTNPAIRDSYLTQVECMAGLAPDYLVLGPELNFLVGVRYNEFVTFSQVYQTAYARAKAISPSTQVGSSWQYDALRENLLLGIPEEYIEWLGPQDFIGLTTYFGFSTANAATYPGPLSVPANYYDLVRARFGNRPIVFTEVGWSTRYGDGFINQALFLNRLPLLMESVKPAVLNWGLQHDIWNYFPGEVAALNDIGLRFNDGTPKPSWDQAMWLMAHGILVDPNRLKQ